MPIRCTGPHLPLIGYFTYWEDARVPVAAHVTATATASSRISPKRRFEIAIDVQSVAISNSIFPSATGIKNATDARLFPHFP